MAEPCVRTVSRPRQLVYNRVPKKTLGTDGEETLGEILGFVGLGNMGGPMAGRLMDAGLGLVVCDVRDGAVDPFVDCGARAASSPAEVASLANTVLLSLPTPEIVEQVALGENGLGEGGAARRVVDFSTIGREMAASLADRLAEKGMRWIDAPVSGGVGGARAGTLAVMVAGPRDDYDDLLDILKVIGRPFYIGEQPGLGQAMKLANNLLSAAAMALSSEAVVMGVKAGIPPAVMIDVLNASTGANTATQHKFPSAILPGTFDLGFATGLMHKDVALFMKEAKAMGLDLTACEAVLERWRQAVETLGPQSDFTEIVKLLEAHAGVEVRGEN